MDNVTVTGLTETLTAFSQFEAVSLRELGTAHVETAEAIADRASTKAPRLSGRLARAIRARRTATGYAAVVEIDDALAPHWKYVEYGTSRQSAQPFLLPAVEGERGPHETRLRAAEGRVEAWWAQQGRTV